MSSVFKNRSFTTSFCVGFIFCCVGIALLLLGYSNLGVAIFYFLPLAIGISSGLLPDLKKAIYGTLLSLLLFSFILVFTQIEGIICVLLATPILLFAVWIGWIIGKHYRKKDKDEVSLKVALTPFLIFVVANLFELFIGSPFVKHEVSSSVILSATPQLVYNNIIAVDTVDVRKNLLQHLGLPIPEKCILTEEKVGGLRYCHFDQGMIVETIKELRKNEYLRMEVTECDLGKDRDWLQFSEDIYNIEELGNNQTKITRTTSYHSNLRPRIYWEYMEGITIKAEQDYVFRNLIKDVNNQL